MPLFEFTVETSEKTYKCQRFVSGQNVVRQKVTVIGIGSKDDPANYGDKSDQRSAMQFNARLIAHQIVKGVNGSKSDV